MAAVGFAPVVIDTNPADIQPVGGAAAAGSTGEASDAGHVHAGFQVLDVTSFGAQCDVRDLTGCAITAATSLLSCAGGAFTTADAGKVMYVYGAGPAGAPLVTTIVTVTSATTVTLAVSASTTVTSAAAFTGTDDTAAWQGALNAVQSNGQTVFQPWGRSWISSTLSIGVVGTIVRGGSTGSQLRYDGTICTPLFNVSGSTKSAWIRDIRLSQVHPASAGTTVDMSLFNAGGLDNLLIDAGGGNGAPPAIGIDFDGAGCHYNEANHCQIHYGGPGGMGIAVRGGSHRNTIIDPIIISGAGADSASSGIYIGNAHSTNLITPRVESTPGNGIFLDTGADATTMVSPYLEGNRVNMAWALGINGPSVTGTATLQSGTVANLQDSGAINPVYDALWPNSGTTVFSNVARLTPTPVKTGNYTAVTGDLVTCSTASAAFTVTLPAAPLDKTQAGVFLAVQAANRAVTIATSGSDVLQVAGGATTMTVQGLFTVVILQYAAATGIWTVVGFNPPIDATAADIQPSGQSAVAGSSGKTADAKHIHPPGSGFLCSPVSYAPVSQTALAVTSTSFAAFSSANVNTGSFVAPPSGSVIVTAAGIIECSASAGFALGVAAHGTTTPMLANSWIWKDSSGTATPRDFSVEFEVTGLTPGTSYTLDLMGAVTSTDTLTILALGTTATSPALTTPGAPVLVTVEAV